MRQIISKKIQHGISLLKTMIIVAIIGILAEVALTYYQEYIERTQVTEQ